MAQAMHLTSIPFDTLQYAKRLQEVGFTEKQAEVQVEIIKEQTIVLNDSINNHLATKADIKLLETEIKRLEKEIADKYLATKADIKLLENNIKLLETEIKRLEKEIKNVEARLNERITLSEERINERIISSEERTKQRISSMGYKTIVALGSLMIAGITILTYLK